MKRANWIWIGLMGLALTACGGGEAPAPSSGDPAEASAPETGSESAQAAAPTGTAAIAGKIAYVGPAVPSTPLAMDADPACAAKHGTPVFSEQVVVGPGGELANVLVYVTSGLPDAEFPTPSAPAVLNQLGCQYVPHVLGVMAGQTIKVLNSDGLSHNVHALPKINKPFNLAMPASSIEAEKTFTKAEKPFTVKCDVHPWMKAYVGVFSHPFFAVSGADGTFKISGLPAGTYEIEAWQETGALLDSPQTATVEVGDDETASADFTFTYSK